jgi:hypothetical protein
VLIEALSSRAAERHNLDKGQIVAATMRPLDKPDRFVFVDALERAS